MLRLPLALGLILSAAALPAAAQSEDEDWQTNCAGGECTLLRPLVETGTDRRVATFVAFVSKGEEMPHIGVAIPLGTAIEPGVRLIAGEVDIDLPFQVCFPDGCRALRQATAAETAALDAADTVEIRFFPFRSDRPLSVTMPFAGFAEALEGARAELAAQ